MASQLMQSCSCPHMRKAAALFTALGLAALIASPVQAQWVVTDPALQTSNEASFLAQLQQTVQQYEALVSHIESVGDLGLSSFQTHQMTLINDPKPLVDQACPNATDPVTVVTGALGLNAQSLTGDIRQSQNQICQQIAILEIHKYNSVAQVLNDMNSYVSVLDGLNQKAEAIANLFGHSQGDREDLSNQINTVQANLTRRFADVQQQLAADDAAIQTLKEQQSMLGNIALKGSPSKITDAMKTVIFAEALKAAE